MIGTMLLIIGIIVAVVAIDAMRHRVLFKMGFRNIFRRKTDTLIVIMGLLVATAIISSSFTVGDTMENWIESEILDDLQYTDVTVYNTTSHGSYVPLHQDLYRDIRSEIKDMEYVKDVVGEVHGRVSVFDPVSLLSRSDVPMIGMDLYESDAFGGFYVDGVEIEPSLEEGEIIIDKHLAKDLDVGGSLIIYSVGHPEGREYTVTHVIDSKGRPAFGGPGKVIMELNDSQIAMGIPEHINFIRITSIGGIHDGALYSDDIFHEVDDMLRAKGSILEARESKSELLDEFKEMMSMFTDIFFVFGSFVIIAGIILTINIFVMLGEERKSEMGMSRAVGMKRRHLSRVFSYEGMFYAGIASAIGALVGVGIAYVIFLLLEDIFAVFGGDISFLSYFSVSSNSLIMAFSAGFLLTMLTIFFTVHRISKLNIVRAIRDIPEPPVSGSNRKLMFMAVCGTCLGVLMVLAGISSPQLWLPVTGVSLILIGAGTIARRWVGDRIAYTVVGILLLVWWMMPFEAIDHFFDDYSAGMEMFILSGLFTVSAGIMVVMLNGSIITGIVEKLTGSGKGSKAVVLTAVSHPLKEKFRTGMTMFIFALIIFAIIVMSMIVGIFDTNMERMIEEQSGGYDIIGLTAWDRPIDDLIMEIEGRDLQRDDFNLIDQASISLVTTSDGSMDSVIGVDRYFVNNNTFGFTEYHRDYSSPEEVWEAVMEDPGLVVTNDPEEFGMIVEDPIGVGSKITFIGEDGEAIEKKVIGLMDQFIVSGYFMSKDAVRSEFNTTSHNLFFISLKEGVDADVLARDMERELIPYGFQPIVIDTVFREVMSAQFMFFNLFSGYMGLGLVVGIAGLGIISLRAVHERRLEIGMMRAIGFKRRMIKYAFMVENSFITLTGIVLGSLLGIGIGWLLWYDGFRPMGWEFYIPWTTIIMIGVIAYLAMLITAIPGAHKASKVSPAEALRFD